MGHDATVLNRLLTSGDALKQADAFLQSIVGLNIDEVGSRQAVLRDKNRSPVLLNIGEQFGRFSLQGGNKFYAHRVIL